MIIKKATLKKLIKQGKAVVSGRSFVNNKTYEIVDRFDLIRTDHVLIGDGDLRGD